MWALSELSSWVRQIPKKALPHSCLEDEGLNVMSRRAAWEEKEAARHVLTESSRHRLNIRYSKGFVLEAWSTVGGTVEMDRLIL